MMMDSVRPSVHRTIYCRTAFGSWMTKVYFVTHLLANNNYGGAETQIFHTMNAINGMISEYKVKLFDQWSDIIEKDNVVHIFNPGSFPTESHVFADFAKSKGARVVVSPISFHSKAQVREQEGFAMSILDRFVQTYRRPLRWPVLRYSDPLRHMEAALRSADLLLPNTTSELEGLIDRFSVERDRCQIIPNGVEMRFASGDPRPFVDDTGLHDFLLYIGKIDERKNVVRMIQAYQDSGLTAPLILIGAPTSRSYLEKCQGIAGENVVFLPPLQHDDPMLASAYAASKVIVLPSYFETPGLSALEGGLAGANVVITSVGGTRDYFQDLAWYVDPYDREDMARKMAQAFEAPRSPKLRDHIAGNYSWDMVGEATVQAYRSLQDGHAN